ncbi:unnamed protein product [Ceratitis capitata]|uniref:(Mediterranean fruit fly) hypothetical protein n=1 Tax=Ceratitis capitata TaxID=7213 RepID=A0A811UZV3_CERCA|nr:unnamed protein product [Ceratitis capitata]
MDNLEQDVPVEFECCFCTTKDFKEFTDAEGVISLPTSDFHKPVCLEMRMAANQANRNLRANQFGLLAPPTVAHLQPTLQPQLAGALAATAGDAHAEVIFSIGGGGGGGVMRTPHHHLPHHTATGLAPIASQSSSTSSSYGTTTSTTIALPLDTSFRYPPFITSYSNNNFNYNYNNNFNTTSVGACPAMSMATGSNAALALGSNLNNNFNINQNNNNNADLASVDSSDTYASCQTHPFHSQGDLTADLADEACALDIDMDNLYINPLEKETATATTTSTTANVPGTTGYIVGLPPTGATSLTAMGLARSQVKKSASGDTALRNLAAGGLSPMDEIYQNFEVQERGSRVSLNENPVPKHRKTRFQSFTSMPTGSAGATNKPRARFEEVKIIQDGLSGSHESSPASSGSKKKRSSFMPGKSLATATKLINQHLFGIQNVGQKAKFESKHSSSIDSIDASPNLEQHRRSKSILKNKSDISRVLADPESERLLADNMSGSGVSDNGTVMFCLQGESGSDYSPNKLPHSILAKSISPPPLRHRMLIQQRSGPATLQSRPTKFQTPRYPEEQALRQVKPMLARTSHMSGDSRYDSTNRDSSLGK